MNHMDFLSAALNFVGGTMIAYVILWSLAELVKRIARKAMR